MRRAIPVLLLAAGLLSVGAAAAAAPPVTVITPSAQLKYYNERLDKLLRKKTTGPVDRDAVRTLASELFDYRELARRSLSQHWDKLSKAQREEFVTTLRELIEKNYVKQLKTNVDYQVVYKDESVDGGEATVATVVKVRTKGKSTDMSIDYRMHKLARWQVYDIITDEVSMVRNYRSQFNKIISKESYDALLKKMRKRIEQNESEDKGDE